MLSLCQWCGKQYETTKPKAKFCGLSCFGKANNHARASNLKGYIVPRLLTDPLLCQVCGKYLPQHGKKYCILEDSGMLKANPINFGGVICYSKT